jgi:hypothetical protein
MTSHKKSGASRGTLRMFGEILLGPLEEKYATAGVGVLPTMVLLGEMCTVVGLLRAGILLQFVQIDQRVR